MDNIILWYFQVTQSLHMYMIFRRQQSIVLDDMSHFSNKQTMEVSLVRRTASAQPLLHFLCKLFTNNSCCTYFSAPQVPTRLIFLRSTALLLLFPSFSAQMDTATILSWINIYIFLSLNSPQLTGRHCLRH